MSSMIRTGRLPEKPWTVEAVARLLAAIIICILMGAVFGTAITYFGGAAPHKLPVLFVAGAIGALLLFGLALKVRARPWPFEKYLRNLLTFLVCIYGCFVLMYAL